jgi:hypothetical protein
MVADVPVAGAAVYREFEPHVRKWKAKHRFQDGLLPRVRQRGR